MVSITACAELCFHYNCLFHGCSHALALASAAVASYVLGMRRADGPTKPDDNADIRRLRRRADSPNCAAGRGGRGGATRQEDLRGGQEGHAGEGAGGDDDGDDDDEDDDEEEEDEDEEEEVEQVAADEGTEEQPQARRGRRRETPECTIA